MPSLQLTFASGESSLWVSRFAVREGISKLFTVTILARSEDPSLDLESIVGKEATFTLRSDAPFASLGGERTWTGICDHMAIVRAEPTGASTYEIRIVPSLCLLTQRRGYRVFQHVSIPEIVDALLREWRILADWTFDRELYPKLEYKVQYGESDYDFVCRLLEEAGIAFLFPGDRVGLTFDDAPHTGDRRAVSLFATTDAGVVRQREVVTRVSLGHDVRPGAHTVRDYDFRNPAFALLGKAEKAAAPEDRYEQFEYRPGAFLVKSSGPWDESPAPPVGSDDKGRYRHDVPYGDALAQRSLESERVGKRGIAFETNTVDLWPGAVLSIENHPHTELAIDKNLLVTDFSLEGEPQHEWRMTGNAVFTAEPYRPPVITRKPRIHSVQSAKVVGPSGQEIHTDEFGRVRVQFPWDREGKSNQNSSVWIRVSQEWAGTGYGMITVPRIGQEVLVAFLDGDPDRPVIVGRLFNMTHPVPYKLPENKTRSAWKTDRSPASGGYNEILFEDSADQELVSQQAEKNLRRLVKHDEIITVANDRQKTVVRGELDKTVGNRVEETDNDRLEEIVKDRTTVAEKKLAERIDGDEIERTLGSQVVWVGGDQHLIVAKTKRELNKDDLHLHVKESRNTSVGAYSLSTSSQQEKIGNKDELETGLALHRKAGTALVGEGAASVTLKGPGGFITIGPGGIDIVGTLVLINAGGSPGSAPDAKPAAPEKPKEATVDAPPLPDPPVPPPKPKPPPPPKEKTWIEIVLLDDTQKPVPSERYQIVLPDGTTLTGNLDERGFARVDDIDPGTCQVSFPEIDGREWGRTPGSGSPGSGASG